MDKRLLNFTFNKLNPRFVYMPNQLNGTVTTAGTRVKLAATSTPTRLAYIQANPGNGGTLYIGNLLVSSTVYGIALPPGDVFVMAESDNDSKIDLTVFYADTSNSGDGFSVLYL